MSKYLERSKDIQEEIIEIRRHLHENPEVGMNLPNTKKYVLEELKKMGINGEVIGTSGITATIGNPDKGPVILLRGDMDALPMKENSGLEFASKNENAHTCGHDMHTAMLLGAAKLLKEDEDKLNGAVKLMFQPGEEILEGAIAMINDGILENPKVDAAIAIHMIPMAPTGTIIYNTGTISASSDIFNIKITGKGGHGAYPNETIDPINVGVHLHLALQSLIAREVDPSERVVLTIGMFNSGDAENIIPQEAILGGTLRTFSQETREYMVDRIKSSSKAVAETFNAKAEYILKGSTSSMIADEHIAKILVKAYDESLPGKVIKMDGVMGGSEDFSEVSVRVPSMLLGLGGGSIEEGYEYAGHHPKVRYNEESIPYGITAYVTGALELMENLSK
ncbi:MAG TPA: M20 family metallopeptidase [Tissierellaceae bacterium]